MRRLSNALAGWIFAWGLQSCAALPDLSEYARQTQQLASAINRTYVQTETDLRQRYAQINRRHVVDTLRRSWQPTQQALAAMTAYADALAKCTATNNDPKAIAQLGTQLNRLATTARNFLPLQGRAAGEIATTAVFLIRQAQLAATRRKLAYLLQEADTVIQRIAILLKENLTDLQRIHRLVLEEEYDDLALKYAKTVRQYEERLKINEGLMPELLAIAQYKQAKLQSRKANLLAEINIDRNPIQNTSEEELVKKRETDLMQVYHANQEFLKSNETIYKEYLQSVSAINERMSQSDWLYFSAINALQSWAQTHASLKQLNAIGKAFSLAEFITAVQNIQQIYAAYERPFNPPRK